MVNDKTHTDSLADVTLVFLLPIPQGNNIEIKLEQSQCNFYLNQKLVEQIQQAQKTGLSLNIPSKLLIHLWYCTCFQYNFVPESKIEKYINKSSKSYLVFLLNIWKIFRNKTLLQNQTNLQTGFTFNSYYNQEKNCILQSVVMFHGDVMQKVQRKFLHDNANLMMIISAHYWLIEQLLNSLRNKLNMLVWEVASLFPAGFFISKIYKVDILSSGNGLLLLILSWLGLALVVAGSRYILFHQLQKRIAINYKYLNWLAWGISCIIPAIAIFLTQKIQPIDIIIFPVVSIFVPLIIQQILSWFWPQVGKLILRRLIKRRDKSRL